MSIATPRRPCPPGPSLVMLVLPVAFLSLPAMDINGNVPLGDAIRRINELHRTRRSRDRRSPWSFLGGGYRDGDLPRGRRVGRRAGPPPDPQRTRLFREGGRRFLPFRPAADPGNGLLPPTGDIDRTSSRRPAISTGPPPPTGDIDRTSSRSPAISTGPPPAGRRYRPDPPPPTSVIDRRPVVSRNPFELGTGDARLPNDGEQGADA